MTALAPAGLVSRVADACLWFGRYVERSESSARVLQATMGLALDSALPARSFWHSVVMVSGEETGFLARFGEAGLDDGELVQRHLVWEARSPVALCQSVAAARDNAHVIRDVLSADVWEVVNELHLWLGQAAAEEQWTADRDGFYRRVRESDQLCLGLLRSTMLHDAALDFIWLGMLLERVGQTARLLDVHHHALAGNPHQVVETAVWLALLRACSGVEPFMKTHTGRVTGAQVAGFLFGERRFPRSIAYCVHSARMRLAAIRSPEDRDLPGGESLARLGALDVWVDERARSTPLHPLHDILTHVVDETAAICDTIGSELLGYGPAPSSPVPAPPPPPSQPPSQPPSPSPSQPPSQSQS